MNKHLINKSKLEKLIEEETINALNEMKVSFKNLDEAEKAPGTTPTIMYDSLTAEQKKVYDEAYAEARKDTNLNIEQAQKKADSAVYALSRQKLGVADPVATTPVGKFAAQTTDPKAKSLYAKSATEKTPTIGTATAEVETEEEIDDSELVQAIQELLAGNERYQDILMYLYPGEDDGIDNKYGWRTKGAVSTFYKDVGEKRSPNHSDIKGIYNFVKKNSSKIGTVTSLLSNEEKNKYRPSPPPKKAATPSGASATPSGASATPSGASATPSGASAAASTVGSKALAKDDPVFLDFLKETGLSIKAVYHLIYGRDLIEKPFNSDEVKLKDIANYKAIKPDQILMFVPPNDPNIKSKLGTTAEYFNKPLKNTFATSKFIEKLFDAGLSEDEVKKIDFRKGFPNDLTPPEAIGDNPTFSRIVANKNTEYETALVDKAKGTGTGIDVKEILKEVEKNSKLINKWTSRKKLDKSTANSYIRELIQKFTVDKESRYHLSDTEVNELKDKIISYKISDQNVFDDNGSCSTAINYIFNTGIDGNSPLSDLLEAEGELQNFEDLYQLEAKNDPELKAFIDEKEHVLTKENIKELITDKIDAIEKSGKLGRGRQLWAYISAGAESLNDLLKNAASNPQDLAKLVALGLAGTWIAGKLRENKKYKISKEHLERIILEETKIVLAEQVPLKDIAATQGKYAILFGLPAEALDYFLQRNTPVEEKIKTLSKETQEVYLQNRNKFLKKLNYLQYMLPLQEFNQTSKNFMDQFAKNSEKFFELHKGEFYGEKVGGAVGGIGGMAAGGILFDALAGLEAISIGALRIPHMGVKAIGAAGMLLVQTALYMAGKKVGEVVGKALDDDTGVLPDLPEENEIYKLIDEINITTAKTNEEELALVKTKQDIIKSFQERMKLFPNPDPLKILLEILKEKTLEIKQNSAKANQIPPKSVNSVIDSADRYLKELERAKKEAKTKKQFQAQKQMNLPRGRTDYRKDSSVAQQQQFAKDAAVDDEIQSGRFAAGASELDDTLKENKNIITKQYLESIIEQETMKVLLTLKG